MLPAPSLDDRRFQDLVYEAKRMVMRRCPEWTDHNVSDPGVILIEAFAYMTDALLYRLNQVPDRLYVKFLDMIGLRMRPATAARAPVTFWLATPPDAEFVVPARTQVTTAGTDQIDPVIFTTGRDLTIVPCRVDGLATERAGEAAVNRTTQLEFGSPVSAFSTEPRVGDAAYLGLSIGTPECAVRLDVAAQADGVGVNPQRPPLAWEAYCDDEWTACDLGADETGGLNRSGSIVLHIPAGHGISVVDGVASAWIRARVVEPEDGQPSYSTSPVFRRLSACTVGGTTTAVNADIVREDLVGVSDGVPGQRFRLASRPVLSGAGEPVVEVGGSEQGWEEWTRVDHFSASGATDRHYVLDAFAGELVFGPMVRLDDGAVRQHGAVPDSGAPVRIRGYAVGGGPLGNVGARTINSLRSSIPFVTAVENRSAASGGTAGESLQEAMDRGPLMLRTRDRAVTAEDYELIAREAAPEVARVRCVPADGTTVPAGSVKLLVVPAAADAAGRVELESLIPDGETFERIANRLNEVRVAGVRVLIEPPRYRGVTVVARLVARPRVKVDSVKQAALEAVYRLISPLPGGGTTGRGWTFGAPVQHGDVFAALREVRGVELVEDLRLYAADPVTGRRGAEAQRLDVDADSLAFSFEHQIRVDAR